MEIQREHFAILDTYPDQWDSHQELQVRIAATGNVIGISSPSFSSMTVTASVLEHQSFLKALQSKLPSLRGPYLAEFMLLSLWAENYGEGLPEGWEEITLPHDYPRLIKQAPYF